MVVVDAKESMLSPFLHKQCSCGTPTIREVVTILPTGVKIIAPICEECCNIVESSIRKQVNNGQGNITKK